jgi:hypothetical protein
MKVIYDPPMSNWLKKFPVGSFLFLTKEKQFAVVETQFNEYSERIRFIRNDSNKIEDWITDANGCGIDGKPLFFPVVDNDTEKAFREQPKTKSKYNDPFYYGEFFDFNYVKPQTSINNIDDKIKKLIELATNNDNEHEASRAAIEACRRMKKKYI